MDWKSNNAELCRQSIIDADAPILHRLQQVEQYLQARSMLTKMTLHPKEIIVHTANRDSWGVIPTMRIAWEV